MNNSLTKVSYYEQAGLNAYPWEQTVKVVNPLSADLGVMRQTLLFGGLESIVRNANRKNANLRFFEVGNCYHYHQDRWSYEDPSACVARGPMPTRTARSVNSMPMCRIYLPVWASPRT